MRFVWDRVACDWVVRSGSARVMAAPAVISDIAPYRSAVSGELIAGRRQHHEHLAAHGLIELGNERLRPRSPWRPMRGSVATSLKQALQDIGGRRRSR